MDAARIHYLVRLLWRPSHLGFCYLDFFFLKRLAGGISFESFARRAWRGQFRHLLMQDVRTVHGVTQTAGRCELLNIRAAVREILRRLAAPRP